MASPWISLHQGRRWLPVEGQALAEVIAYLASEAAGLITANVITLR
jgi:hypothetical protein